MLYYFHRLLFKTGFFKRINVTAKTEINHKKFIVPIINETGYSHLLKHEEWLTVLLQKIFSFADGAFVDVGMNIGQTLLKKYSIDTERTYIGFEPNPGGFYYCQKLVEVNRFTNHHLFPIGLFDKNEVLTLYLEQDMSSGASVLKEFRSNMSRYKKQINVPVFKGDEILGKLNKKIGILKADVEGAELEVIKGSIEIIGRDLPFLILEALPVYSLENASGQYRKKRQDELVSILSKMGYILFRIDETNCSLTELNHIEVHGEMKKTNYLFVHATKAELFLGKDKTRYELLPETAKGEV